MSTDRRISEILNEYGESWKESVWKVQGTPVIYHKALERIAIKASISFDVPTIIRAERDEAVMLVVGRKGERMEWSIGEALIGANYRVSGKQAAYVYAIAEKRAKDRVILKLIELHGLLYSEEEADDFKDAAPAAPHQPASAAQVGGAPPAPSTASVREREPGEDDGDDAPLDQRSSNAIADTLIEALEKQGPLAALNNWWDADKTGSLLTQLADADYPRVAAAYVKRALKVARTSPELDAWLRDPVRVAIRSGLLPDDHRKLLDYAKTRRAELKAELVGAG